MIMVNCIDEKIETYVSRAGDGLECLGLTALKRHAIDWETKHVMVKWKSQLILYFTIFMKLNDSTGGFSINSACWYENYTNDELSEFSWQPQVSF